MPFGFFRRTPSEHDRKLDALMEHLRLVKAAVRDPLLDLARREELDRLGFLKDQAEKLSAKSIGPGYWLLLGLAPIILLLAYQLFLIALWNEVVFLPYLGVAISLLFFVGLLKLEMVLVARQTKACDAAQICYLDYRRSLMIKYGLGDVNLDDIKKFLSDFGFNVPPED